MLMTILNVIYVLLALAMIGLILMQRGTGAQAGAGFGGGASATVFGSRGASNFLSKTTKWLAIVFFAISLFMAWHATRSARGDAQADLGVMAQAPATATKAPAGTIPAAPVAAPVAGQGSTVPAAPAQDASVPAATSSETQPSHPQPVPRGN